MTARFTRCFGVALLGLVACSSSNDSGASPEEAEGGSTFPPLHIPDGGTAPLVGSFGIELVAPTDSNPEGHAAVLGKVYDGPTPTQIVWEETLVDGDCRLIEPRVPFCEEPCGGSAACVEDDQCQPYPSAQSVGSVTLSGVRTVDGATRFSMDPVANTYQPTGGIRVPYAPFDEGDDIELEAAGGAFAPFAIAARGIAPLVLAEGELQLTADAPLALTWTAAGLPEVSSIFVKVDISHHGGTKGMIQCETADDGSLEIAAPLVTRLLELGVAGFPTILLDRKAIGATLIEVGRVELVASSSVERAVQIEGLVSCTSDDTCPSGQTCQADLRCE